MLGTRVAAQQQVPAAAAVTACRSGGTLAAVKIADSNTAASSPCSLARGRDHTPEVTMVTFAVGQPSRHPGHGYRRQVGGQRLAVEPRPGSRSMLWYPSCSFDFRRRFQRLMGLSETHTGVFSFVVSVPARVINAAA
jgi:hypothetical protein